MKNQKSVLAVAALGILLLPGTAFARIPEPDHVFYGRATAGGAPLTAGIVTVLINGGTTPVASFALTPQNPGQYVLRIPIDSVDPQALGTARPGDAARLFINGDLSGTGVIGNRGDATSVDLETDFDDSIRVNDVTVVEGNGGTTNAVFSVRLGSPISQPVTVDYATADGTATGGADYQVLSGRLTFPTGSTIQTVTIPVVGDTLNELDETFFVNLSNPVLATIARNQGVGTITNDDPLPTLTIDDVTVSEPGSGVANATFTVSLNTPSGRAVSINYGTGDGTATPAADYEVASGTLVFPPLTTTRQVTVRILSDTLLESTETFFLKLNGIANAVQQRPWGQGWIQDNTPGQRLQFSSSTYSVSEAGLKATVTVQRIGNPTGILLVDYQASDGTAKSGLDYTAVQGTLSFASGVKSQTFAVPINNDTIVEGSETILLSLSNPVGGAALGSPSTAVLSIVDNDVAGKVTLGAAAYSIGEAGPQATITVKRAGGNASAVTVEYDTSDGTATAPADYTATSGILSFGEGVLTQAFTIPIKEDTLSEGDETLNVTLSAPTGGATLGTPNSAVLTILEDERTMQFSSAAYTAKEGTSAVITVKRSGPVTDVATVDYTTSDGSAHAGSDYTTSSGTLTFSPGIKSKTFIVKITNDTEAEVPETILVGLGNPAGGAVLGQQSTAVLTVQDNDIGGSVSFTLPTYTVKESGPTATVTVTRSGGTASGASVDYATSDGTAVAGTNYTATSGTLTFGSGQATASFSVPVQDDGIPNSDHTVNLTLSNPGGGAGLGPRPTAVLVIQSIDPNLQFSAAAFSVPSNGVKATITVKRSGPSTGTVMVDYHTSDGTATDGQDYTSSTGTLVFPPGMMTKTFLVPIIDDPAIEGDETVNLTLSNPGGGAGLGVQSTAVLTILSNSPRMSFGGTAYSVTESTPKALITVRRSSPTNLPVSVDFATADGTAVAGQDYVATSGTLVFGIGVASRTFPVAILNDTLTEPNQTVLLNLANPAGGAILGTPATATLTIVSNDLAGAFQFSAAAYSVSETGPLATITVTRTGGTSSGVTVDFATSDGTAIAGTNYQATSGTLIFGNNEASKTFTVEVLDDLVHSGNATVNLTLSNPTGGATLGSQSSSVLWIVETP